LRLILIFLCLLSFLILSAELSVEQEEWIKNHPGQLSHWKDNNEAQDYSRVFTETNPPVAPVRNIAEFEPMEAVLIRYPLGIPYSLIAEMSEDTKVITIVSSTSVQNNCIADYQANGVNMNNCEFMIAPTNQYWTRDYGPWFIFDGNDELGIVDFPYNRPRPDDDNIPVLFAQDQEINLFGMNVIHTGGNYMTDGQGISASTDLVITENPTLTEGQIRQKMQSYLGISDYHMIPDPNNTYIDHIDCWGKYLFYDKVLIREVPVSHAQYDEIEEVVTFFSNQISSLGTPYRIYRVYTPNNQPYTNSLILNDKVFVPQTGSNYDDEALAAYETAMPGYDIIGIYSGNWQSTDALHCRTKEIADKNMLYVWHVPINPEEYSSSYEVIAEIKAHSGGNLIADSLKVYWKSENAIDFSSALLTLSGEDIYHGYITAQTPGETIEYYLSAADTEDKYEKFPYMGKLDPLTFEVPSVSLSAPANLTITVSTEVNLSWQDVPDANLYKVYYTNDLSADDWILLGTTVNTSYTVSIDYNRAFFRVTASIE